MDNDGRHNFHETDETMKQEGSGGKEGVSIIIPAFNEEGAVSAQVENIRSVMAESGLTYEIVVVDDGSGDRTAELALQARASVMRHEENRGYGASLKTGINAAKFDTIVIIDADGTYPQEQIPDMVKKLGNSDMVVGARTGSNVHIPLIRRPAKWILRWLAERIAGQKIPDLNSGLRVFSRKVAKQYFSILPNGFSFTTTITLAMLADDYRVVFHSIDYHKRIGKSKITPRNFMDFMILVVRMAMLFQPLRVFLPLSCLFGAVGFLKAVFDVALVWPRIETFGWSSLLNRPVISTSAILMLLVALQVILIGMVADGVVRRIAQSSRELVPSQRSKVMKSSNKEVPKETRIAE